MAETLMETTMFHTPDSVTEFTLHHEIGKEEIRKLFDTYAYECTILKSACSILGFVEYKEGTDQAQDVILKYGQVEDQYDRDRMIPTLKLYPNGNLSNAWDHADDILKKIDDYQHNGCRAKGVGGYRK